MAYGRPCTCEAGNSCYALKSNELSANRDPEAEELEAGNPESALRAGEAGFTSTQSLAVTPCETRPLAMSSYEGGEGSSNLPASQAHCESIAPPDPSNDGLAREERGIDAHSEAPMIRAESDFRYFDKGGVTGTAMSLSTAETLLIHLNAKASGTTTVNGSSLR